MMKRHMKHFTGMGLASLVALGLLLSACTTESWEPEPTDETTLEGVDPAKRKTIFGEGGLNLFGSRDNRDSGGRLGVNSFLWRASLDTISFMPLNSADPFGGVIITDWHSSTEAPSERFKLNVYILDRTLRADGIRVAVFKQVQDPRGVWKDAHLAAEIAIKIEDAILIRARKLRNQSVR